MTNSIQKIKLQSLEETENFAKDFSSQLKPGMIIGLEGELGAGKTTLVRSIYEALDGDRDIIVTSPTFTILQTYPLKEELQICHLDLYRLDSFLGFEELGLEDEELESSIVFIEWINKFPELKKELSFYIEMRIIDEDSREIQITRYGLVS